MQRRFQPVRGWRTECIVLLSLLASVGQLCVPPPSPVEDIKEPAANTIENPTAPADPPPATEPIPPAPQPAPPEPPAEPPAEPPTEVTGWRQAAQLFAPSPEADDRFGTSVALSGDTLVVGAPGSADYTGAAYVYVHDASGWQLESQLVASDARSAVGFGAAVALDGGTAMVGAPAQSPLETPLVQSGAAYVFERVAGSWTQRRRLAPAAAQSYDYFGQSLAINQLTAIVGAFGRNALRGCVYVYTAAPGGWTQRVELRPDAGGVNWFGWAVDLDADTAIIGAHVQEAGTGAAYIFRGSGANWSQEQKLLAPDAAESDNFGQAVAISGETAFVGAPGKHEESGQVYAFIRAGQRWALQQVIASPEPAAQLFGYSVDIAGDTLVVGVPRASAVIVYVRHNGVWVEETRLVPEGPPDAAKQFGFSSSLSGGRVAVGAEGDSRAVGGTAYVLESR